jgi:hypothetical protein
MQIKIVGLSDHELSTLVTTHALITSEEGEQREIEVIKDM